MTHDPLTLAAAVILGTLGVARAVRLVTSDAYPPMVALRLWWTNQTLIRGGWRAGWGPLLTCPFCFAPYAAAVDLGWVILAGTHAVSFWSGAWWVVNLWAAVSYAAAMVVVRDEPPAED